MKAKLEFEIDNTEEIAQVIRPSLDQGNGSEFEVRDNNNLEIDIKAETMATLWGCVNSAFRLTKLTKSILN